LQTYQSTTNGPQTTSSSGSTTEQAKEKAKEQAQQAAGQARGAVRGQVDQRSTQAGQQVRTQSEDIRSVAQGLRDQGKEGPAKIAEQAADRAERVGSYLERSSGDDILADVEDYARRNPWAVALGGLALGFAASRVLRASSSERYESGWDTSRRARGGALPPPGTTATGAGTPAPTGYDPPVATTPPVAGGVAPERL
jgi:hypothetical protein